jgi:4-diphosphocytidyl-2C-methyl-D-erythritol kinase
MPKLTSSAKINLFLAIGPRDDSASAQKPGYHKIETVMARTDTLQDFIEIEKIEAPHPVNSLLPEPKTVVKFTAAGNFQPEINALNKLPPEKNSILRAIQILQREASKIAPRNEKPSDRKLSYRITVQKNIPPQSGLGGAASNAATILTYLNKAEDLNLPAARLMELGAEIGMDVPFFVSCITRNHKVAHCTGYGEQVAPLPDLPKNLQIKIHPESLKNLTPSSTPKAYAAWDELIANSQRTKPPASSNKILTAIHAQDPHAIITTLHNDFEKIADLTTHPTHPTSPAATLLAGSGGAFVSFHVL